jgi:hypothetical protein
VTKRLEESLILVVFSVVLGETVDCSVCYFPKIIFYCNGSSLYVLMSVFCTYVVLEVLPNYHCCAAVRCRIWVSCVIYRVVRY